MAWIVKLVSIGAEGEEHSTDIMRIAKPGDLTDLASLGLTLAEGKRLLAGVQQEIVAGQASDDEIKTFVAVDVADKLHVPRSARYVNALETQVRRRLRTGVGASPAGGQGRGGDHDLAGFSHWPRTA